MDAPSFVVDERSVLPSLAGVKMHGRIPLRLSLN
jgi:hypothetical protein